MSDVAWRPWKATAIGVAVAGATALGTILMLGPLPAPALLVGPDSTAPVLVSRPAAAPSAADIEACRDYARTFAPEHPNESVKGASAKTVRARQVGGEARTVDERYAQAYQACMKGRGFDGA